jgi:N-methylhydantoinase A
MANGIRRVTIQRGQDPREFSLIAFGGAGPMHAADVARMLQIPEVIIPSHPGATSAWGLVTVDSVHDFVRSHIQDLDVIDPLEVHTQFEEMRVEAARTLAGEGFADDAVRVELAIDIRYVGQVRALTIRVDDSPRSTEDLDELRARFHAAYEAEFKYAVSDLAVESCALRISAFGIASRPSVKPPVGFADPEMAVVDRRQVYFPESSGFTETPFYDRRGLAAGTRIEGPAVIEQYDSTTVVPPDCTVDVDETGNLVIRIH